MNVNEKLSNAVTAFEKSERELDEQKRSLEQVKRTFTMARKELARTMKAAGEPEMRHGRRTYRLTNEQERSADGAVIVVEVVEYDEFTGKVL